MVIILMLMMYRMCDNTHKDV